MALEGRCERASRKAFKIGLHKFARSRPAAVCLTDYVAEGLEPDYRDRPSSITVPPGRLAAVSGARVWVAWQETQGVCLTAHTTGQTFRATNPRGKRRNGRARQHLVS